MQAFVAVLVAVARNVIAVLIVTDLLDPGLAAQNNLLAKQEENNHLPLLLTSRAPAAWLTM